MTTEEFSDQDIITLLGKFLLERIEECGGGPLGPAFVVQRERQDGSIGWNIAIDIDGMYLGREDAAEAAHRITQQLDTINDCRGEQLWCEQIWDEDFDDDPPP